VSTSDDPEAAAQRVESAIGFLLAGVQSLVETGIDMPSAFEPGSLARASAEDPTGEDDPER
jgi:hypothetical protein